MARELYSVEQVAAKLGLHVRTVRNYVRDGRLKAVRIGKQYRVSAEDLEAFTGISEPGPARSAELSAVAELEADRDTADRLATYVLSMLRGAQDLRVETIYDKERGLMKIIVFSDLAAGAELLKAVASLAEGLP